MQSGLLRKKSRDPGFFIQFRAGHGGIQRVLNQDQSMERSSLIPVSFNKNREACQPLLLSWHHTLQQKQLAGGKELSDRKAVIK